MRGRHARLSIECQLVKTLWQKEEKRLTGTWLVLAASREETWTLWWSKDLVLKTWVAVSIILMLHLHMPMPITVLSNRRLMQLLSSLIALVSLHQVKVSMSPSARVLVGDSTSVTLRSSSANRNSNQQVRNWSWVSRLVLHTCSLLFCSRPSAYMEV